MNETVFGVIEKCLSVFAIVIMLLISSGLLGVVIWLIRWGCYGAVK